MEGAELLKIVMLPCDEEVEHVLELIRLCAKRVPPGVLLLRILSIIEQLFSKVKLRLLERPFRAQVKS